MALEKKEEQRVRFLRVLYEATEGHTKITKDYWKLGEAQGLTRGEISAVADYLVNVAHWAAYSSLTSMTITAAGIAEVERQMAVENQRIPPQVVGEVSAVFDQTYTHENLNTLFLQVGVPEEYPSGTKSARVRRWLHQIDADPSVDAIALLGRSLRDFMDAKPPSHVAYDDDRLREWEAPRSRIREALAACGLSYYPGGKIIGGALHTPSKTLADFIKERNLPALHAEFERALSSVETDPPAAATAACAILETVCREYIAEEKLTLPADQSIHPLWKTVQGHLGLSPAGIHDNDLKKILGGLASIVDGVGAFRTHGGSAHGKDSKSVPIEPRHARLAVHAAHTVVTFILETWTTKKP